MKTLQQVSFSGGSGATLAAQLDLPPDGEPIACALFAHCFTCSKDLHAARNISRALTQQRIATLRFDFTGLGRSEGEFADTDFSSNVEDLVAAAAYMEREWEAPALLIGHSLGGAAVICVAERIPSARATVTIGAPFDPWHASGLFAESHDEIERKGEATVTIGERPFRVRKQLLDSLRATRHEEALRDLDRALLIFHSPVDQTVGIENAARIYTAARHPESFISLDQADHLLTDERDSCYVGRMIAAWVERYLPAPSPPTLAELHEGFRVVTRTGSEGFRTEIMADHHGLVADEPVAIGGADTGPTPYDLLMAGLGACTGMTLQMYARRKKWPLESATVHLRHNRIHAEDCESCEEQDDARMDRIQRVVEITGALDEAQRARLLEIADRCPVHRTLEAGVRIETTLGE